MSTLPAARPFDMTPAKTEPTPQTACCGGCTCRSAAQAAPAPVARAADALLAQCAGFLASLDDASYVRPSKHIAGSTIGQHVRHTLDHFAAAVRALDGGPIDYDHRERATPIETSRDAALRSIEAIRRPLRGVDDSVALQAVRVRVMLTGDGLEAELASTFAREIAFAAHHATHHHAMMAAIASEHGGTSPAGFGKAPSTIQFERAAGA